MTSSPRINGPLVTGGVGFIGSNLAIQLASEGNFCTVVDSLIPQYGGNLRNIESSIQSSSIKVNISDVRDIHSLEYLLSGVNTIFNLAGQTSHMDSMSDPFSDLEINAKSQLSILEVCRKLASSVRIVFASTRQIYGKPEYLPVDEIHPLNPVDVNGINKLAGEQYHLLYNKVYGIKSTVLRLTNTYGPRMRIKDARQTFLGIWIRNLILGKPFEVWGGNQIRDYTYVDDCVSALKLAGSDDRAVGKIYNLGGYDDPITLLETANILVSVAKDMGVPIIEEPFVVKEYPSDRINIDIGDYYSNDSLIRSELGWKPRVSLREGFRRTLTYYSENLDYYL